MSEFSECRQEYKRNGYGFVPFSFWDFGAAPSFYLQLEKH